MPINIGAREGYREVLLHTLDTLGYRRVEAQRGDPTNESGWHPELKPGEYYVESWSGMYPDGAIYTDLHIESDPENPLPPYFHELP